MSKTHWDKKKIFITLDMTYYGINYFLVDYINAPPIIILLYKLAASVIVEWLVGYNLTLISDSPADPYVDFSRNHTAVNHIANILKSVYIEIGRVH